ncbi:hypothetical protein C2E23DRAFT_832697 [Lenzites betulinus]|nr:hypothetical protein C2E23DRAFT_832697 [Lenzites betulinus]
MFTSSATPVSGLSLARGGISPTGTLVEHSAATSLQVAAPAVLPVKSAWLAAVER